MNKNLINAGFILILLTGIASAQMRIPDPQGLSRPATTSGYGGSTYGRTPSSGGGASGVAASPAVARKMQERVHNRVKPPLQGSGKMVIVTTSVGTNGQVLSAKVKKSSGNKTLDAAAISTIKSSAPFATNGSALTVDLALP